MNSISHRIFQLLKPLSPLALEPLKAVAQTANSLGLPYFLAGATARDLVLENIFGRPPGKLTRDLDFGFALSDWKEFENLKAVLISTGRFKPDRAIHVLTSATATTTSPPKPFRSVRLFAVVSTWCPFLQGTGEI